MPAWLQGLALAALAASLRFATLGRQPIWCDEYYTWIWVSKPSYLSEIIHILAADIYPPLYQILTRLACQIDDSPFYLRSISALGGSAAAVFCWAILKRGFSSRVALSAGLLAALSPLGIYYSQDAKFYSFLAGLSMWMLYEFLEIFEQEGRSAWRLGLAVTASCYTSYLTPYLLAPLLIALVWKAWQGKREQALCAWRGIFWGGMAALPLLPFFLKGMAIFQQGFDEPHGRLILPWYSAQNFSLGFWISENKASLGAALCLLGLAGLWRLRRHPQFFRLLTLLLFAVLPPLLNWISSMSKPVYSDRAVLGSAYAWIAVAAAGLFALPRSLRLACMALLVSLQITALARYYDPANPVRVDFAVPYQAFKPLWQPGEAVFHNTIQSLYPFKFMARREGLAMPNWVRIDAPVLGEAVQGFRARWRLIKAWLETKGLPIDAGMEKSRVWSPRLEEEALKGVTRLWFIRVDEDTQQRVYDPQLNITRFNYRRPGQEAPDPKTLPWLAQNGFRFLRSQPLAPGIDAHLFERKKR